MELRPLNDFWQALVAKGIVITIPVSRIIEWWRKRKANRR